MLCLSLHYIDAGNAHYPPDFYDLIGHGVHIGMVMNIRIS